MKLRQIILAVSLALPLGASVVLGLNDGGWYYCILIASMIVILGILELISYKRRGRTISQDIGRAPKWLFWFVTGSFMFLGLGMSIHWILHK